MNKIDVSKKLIYDKNFIVLIFVFINQSMAIFCSTVPYFMGIAQIETIVTILCMVVCLVSWIPSLRITNGHLNVLFIIMLGLLLTAINGINIKPILIVLVLNITYCIIIFLTFGCIDDFEMLYFQILLLCKIFLCIKIVLFLVAITQNGYLLYSNKTMPMAYSMVLEICFCLDAFNQENDKFALVVAIAGIILTVIFSERGPLLILFVVFFYLEFKRKGVKGIVPSLFLGLLVLVVFSNSNSIYLFFKKKGIDISLLRISSLKALIDSNGRFDYFRIALKAIKENPLGYGIGGDQYAISIYSGRGVYRYPHNIFLEIFLQYGVVFGTMLSFLLVNRVVRFNSEDRYYKRLVFLFGTILIKLLLSSTYTCEVNFFILLSLLFQKRPAMKSQA